MFNNNLHKFEFAFGEKKAIIIELDSDMAKTYSSYSSMKNDMVFVIKAFELISKMNSRLKISEYNIIHGKEHADELTVIRCLYQSAIVTYAKAFVDSNSRKMRLQDNLFKDDGLKKYHSSLMEQRMNYHAHEGKSAFSTHRTFVAFDPDDQTKYQLSSYSVNMLKQAPNIIDKYILVVKYVVDHVSAKLQKCGERLLSDEIIPNLTKLFYEAK